MANDYLKDGFSTTLKFQNFSEDVYFAEVTIKPIGYDGRGFIDITSMRSVEFIQKAPKALIDCPDLTLTCQYKPSFMDRSAAAGGDVGAARGKILNINQLIYLTYPLYNNILVRKTLQFYGWCSKLEPTGEHKEGEQPLLAMTICVSNLIDVSGQVYAPRFIN